MSQWLRSYLAALIVLLLILPVAFGVLVLSRSVENWMDGYGFTPVAHVQPFVPASFSPASLTIVTLPGEVAQP